MEEDNTTFSPEFCSWLDELLQSPSYSASTSVFDEDYVASLFAKEPIEDVQREEPIQQVQQQNQAETSRSALLQPTDVVDPWIEHLVAYSQPPTYDPLWQQSTVVASAQKLEVQPDCKQEYYVNQVQIEPEVSECQMAPVPSTSEPRKIDRRPSTKKKKVLLSKISVQPACKQEYYANQGQVESEGATSRLIVREKNHACPYCDQKFTGGNHLGRHVRSQHPGERPYKCEYEGCNRAFTWRQSLFSHIQIHTQKTQDFADLRMSNQGETNKRRAKNHACPYCDNKFIWNSLLRGHIRSQHTGERPYKCEYEGCNRAYVWRRTLRRHIKIHTQGKPLQCPICETSFGTTDYLKTHIRRVHGKPE